MEFYFDMIIRWGALIIFSFVCLIETKEELMIVVKKRMVLILLLIFYAGICTVISIIFPIKPFLVRYTIDELKITEGYCYVTYGARLSHINIGLSPLDFDVSLWISEYKRQIEKKIEGQYIKVWHREQMVYQISKDDEIIFSIDDANQNIEKYNFWVVPLYIFVIISFSFILELMIVQIIVRAFVQEKS